MFISQDENTESMYRKSVFNVKNPLYTRISSTLIMYFACFAFQKDIKYGINDRNGYNDGVICASLHQLEMLKKILRIHHHSSYVFGSSVIFKSCFKGSEIYMDYYHDVAHVDANLKFVYFPV